VNADAVLRELTGLRALARSLVHGDADADDLIQDAAVATIEHPPQLDDRPVRPWLAVVLRNRRRMDRRAEARRRAREEALAPALETDDRESPDAALDRARVLERLAAALVALEEPYRSTIVKRYLDGQSAAQIARAQGVPAGTVRWRLSTGLERLRAALAAEPRWKAMLAPLALPGAIVKTKGSIVAIVVIILLLLGGALVYKLRGDPDRAEPVATQPTAAPSLPRRTARVDLTKPEPARDPLPGQGRATIEAIALEGGSVSGRVINWSTGDGVANAELTFTGQGGATTVRSRGDGGFELAPPAPGRFRLSAIGAPGFLPFAPELLHSTVHVELTRERAVRGVTVFLFPAVDYQGRVVDPTGAAVAGARVRLLGTPAGEQAIDKLETEWTTDKDGRFAFHSADDAVFEAVRGTARGWARLDRDVAITRQLVIAIDQAPARDATITGRVVDAEGSPIADVLVRAEPADRGRKKVLISDAPARATAFATTEADGTFTLEDLDRDTYDLAAQAIGGSSAPTTRPDVAGGSRGITLAIDVGAPLAGMVESTDGPVPAYTLLVMRRAGTARHLVLARSIVDASGRFEVRVRPGDYELVAAASGWAPSAAVKAAAGDTDVKLVVSAGATLRGTVIAADGGGPLPYARIMREAHGGGASAQPANAGTVTRADGTFELTGLPPGPVSITIGAGGFHPKIEAGMIASDGATLGPLTIPLTRLAEGEKPAIELVGIGVQLAADGDALRVERVIAGGGAAAAGIVAGDRVVAVDGVSASELGVDGAVAKIRGTVGTTVAITLRRGESLVPLVVERRKIRA
jgi:RNA polymerase sigma factor (sigma-70 family)